MDNIAEIIKSTTTTRFTSACGPVLDLCYDLARDGRFDEISTSLSTWFEYAPHTETFIKFRLPSIILDAWILRKTEITFDGYFHGMVTLSETGAAIAKAAHNGAALTAAVDNAKKLLSEVANSFATYA